MLGNLLWKCNILHITSYPLLVTNHWQNSIKHLTDYFCKALNQILLTVSRSRLKTKGDCAFMILIPTLWKKTPTKLQSSCVSATFKKKTNKKNPTPVQTSVFICILYFSCLNHVMSWSGSFMLCLIYLLNLSFLCCMISYSVKHLLTLVLKGVLLSLLLPLFQRNELHYNINVCVH